MTESRSATAMLIAEPAAALIAAFGSYFVVAKFLPGFLVRIFPPSVDGGPAISAETLAGPLHWVGVAAAVLFAVQAAVLARRARSIYRSWLSRETPSCPLCSGPMKRKRDLWRCYWYPVCKGKA